MKPLTMIAVLAGAGCALVPADRSADALTGDWQLVSVVSPGYSAEVGSTPTPPIVHFQSGAAKGSVSGTDGCNDWAGDYTVPADGDVRIGPLARTLRQCIRIYSLQEGGYGGAELESVSQFSVTGGELVLASSDGRTRVVFRR